MSDTAFCSQCEMERSVTVIDDAWVQCQKCAAMFRSVPVPGDPPQPTMLSLSLAVARITLAMDRHAERQATKSQIDDALAAGTWLGYHAHALLVENGSLRARLSAIEGAATPDVWRERWERVIAADAEDAASVRAAFGLRADGKFIDQVLEIARQIQRIAIIADGEESTNDPYGALQEIAQIAWRALGQTRDQSQVSPAISVQGSGGVEPTLTETCAQIGAILERDEAGQMNAALEARMMFGR